MYKYRMTSDDAAEVMRAVRVVHVHGQLGYLPWQGRGAGPVRSYELSTEQSEIYTAAQGLALITDEIDEGLLRVAS